MRSFTLLLVLGLFSLLLPTLSNAQSAKETISTAPSHENTTYKRAADQFIIKYTEGAALVGENAPNGAARLAQLESVIGSEVSYFRPMAGGAHVMRIADKLPEAELQALADQLTALGDVEYAEVDAWMQIANDGAPVVVQTAITEPNDPNYSSQWHYKYIPGTSQGINLPNAWDITTGSSSVVVAVLDTGIRPHADIASRLVGGYDMIADATTANDGNGRDSDPSDPGDWCPPNFPTSSWHGTHVAGTIGASTNNGMGVAGVDWNASLLTVRVLGKCGGYLSDISDGIYWASGLPVSGVPTNTNPADVINMSLGGSGSCGSTYQNAINAAVGNGSVIVVAAGNSNAPASNYRPASCNNVISVASSTITGDRAYYSNYGSAVDVAAPGGETAISSEGVLSTLNTGSTTPGSDSYAWYQGTSMAAPHVAGVASLMRAVDGSLTPAQIEQTLKTTARAFPSGSGCNSAGCGAGIIDAFDALSSLSGSGSIRATSAATADGAGNAKTIFKPNDDIRYYVGVNNTTGSAQDADFVWAITGPCSYSDGWTGPLTVPAGTASFYLPRTLGASVCDGTYNVAVSVTDSEGTTSRSTTFTVAKNLYCSTTSTTINDNATATNNITVSDSGSITDLNVLINADHTWVGDLIFTLKHNGTDVVIFDRPGVPATEYGCEGDNLAVMLDDEASSPVEDACDTASTPTIEGGYRPNNALSGFDSADINGTWTLEIQDVESPDPGELTQWCIIAETSTATAPAAPQNVNASDGTYSDRVRVTWNASTNATSYKIYRNTSNSASGRTQIGTSAGTSYDDLTAAADTLYYYWVVAMNSVGSSGFSSSDSGKLGSQPSGAVVRISPTSSTVSVSTSEFCVDVTVSDVTELGSFEFDLSYPKDLLQVNSIEEGAFLGSTGRTTFPVGPEIDNANGEASFGVASLGSGAGPSGSGILAKVCLTPQADGNADLTFNQTKLTDVPGTTINHTNVGGSVTISSCALADVDCDGDVDIVDIQLVAARWNSSSGDANYDAAYDLDNDGDIDIADIQIVAGQWGSSRSSDATQGQFTFGLSPNALEATTGDSLTVALDVTDAINLAAFETTLHFDAAHWQVNGVTYGDFLTNSGQTQFDVAPQIDNTLGTLTFGAATFGDLASVSGSGSLAFIELTAIGEGSGTLSLINSQATTANGAPHAVDTFGSSYQVSSEAPTAVALSSAEATQFGQVLLIVSVLLLVAGTMQIAWKRK